MIQILSGLVGIIVNGNNKILLTGARGYLGGALHRYLESYNTVITFYDDVRYAKPVDCDQVDMVIHMASPIDNTDIKKTASTIIEGTVNMLDFAKQHNAVFVFASTMGVYDNNLNDVYANCKLAMENYIKSVYNKYVVLRIPRVYSKCREKGLVRLLKDGDVPDCDMHKIIEFLTLDEFISQSVTAISNINTVYEYKNTLRKSIHNIKKCLEI